MRVTIQQTRNGYRATLTIAGIQPQVIIARSKQVAVRAAYRLAWRLSGNH